MNLLVGLRAFEEQGATIDSVGAIGGGAHSNLWLQILADVWGVPVRRRSLVDEANALGAAVVGGVGVGVLPGFEVAPSLSEVVATYVPDPGAHERYTHHYEQFLDAYRRLEPFFEQR